MAKYLVIVESPAKVKTVKKYLGANYEVAASMGHVRDLPKSRLGIDVEHDFEPKYITIRGKGELLASLRKAAKKADKVYLATDPDREGEVISCHLAEALKIDPESNCRVTFIEITNTAVKAAIKQPRKIDMDLVDAQQARRVLDRIVGYKISPLLWKKVKPGLSAGRVQSVAGCTQHRGGYGQPAVQQGRDRHRCRCRWHAHPLAADDLLPAILSRRDPRRTLVRVADTVVPRA